MAGRLTVSTLNDDTGVLAVRNGMTGIAKAWVNFLGSNGTRNDSFNVSSVTRNATGDYTVNFTTAMPNANYSTTIQMQTDTTGTNNRLVQIFPAASAQTTTTVRVGAFIPGSSGFDPQFVCVTVHSS